MTANGPETSRRSPSIWRVTGRGLVVAVVASAAAHLLAAIVPGFEIDGPLASLGVVVAVGVINALVWPALRWLIAPIGVLTLGIGALLVNALVVWVALDAVPGVTIDGFWNAVITTLGLSLMSSFVSSLLAIDDDEWFDRRTARSMTRRRTRSGRVDASTLPSGLVIVQLDGLSRPVLERAMRSGDAPTLAAWRADGHHRLLSWTPEWSCQTGVSQCGILHGDVHDMPAFRWMDKATGAITVSNHPRDAAAIEQAHNTRPGLLAIDGSSYGNLFTGGASRAVLTMSVAGTTKERRIGSGYGRYFSQPYQAFRTLTRVIAEIWRERRAAADQRRRDVQPRVERHLSYAFLRAFTTVVSRDVSLAGVLNDMAEGRSVIYVDFLGYDEVAHHSGPERHDTLRVVRGLDHDLARIDRARTWCARRYEIIVLSDHGQTQGATFRDRYGERLADVVGRATGGAETGRSDRQEQETESTAILRSARGTESAEHASAETPAVVLGSGNLGLVYLTATPHRMSLQEIERTYPALVSTLVAHPGIGFVLVQCERDGAVVLGASGRRVLESGDVTGSDPLEVFGPYVPAQVARVANYSNLPDLMVNSLYDPITAEVAAFEEQVSSHGGLGGDQQHPFLMVPTALSEPADPLVGPVAVHEQLRRWLAELGQPVDITDIPVVHGAPSTLTTTNEP